MSNDVYNFIVSLLLRKAPLPEGINIIAYRYLDAGHIDSLALIKFIFEIEEQFNIELTPDETNSDEFRSVGGLVDLVLKKIENNA